MVDMLAEKHESGCTCFECRVNNADARCSAVVFFCLAATLVAVVWGSIRLGTGSGLSLQAVLLAPVAIATAGALLYLLIGWRKPCADKNEIARESWSRALKAGYVSQAKYDKQARLGFPSERADIPYLGPAEWYVLFLPVFALLALVATVVAWGLSKL